MRALVTGGAGFIGGHVVARLVRDGWETAVLDDFSSGSRDGVPPEAEVCEVDVADARATDEIVRLRPEVIVHAAAQVSVARSMVDPGEDWRVNVLGTQRVIEGARRVGARVVFLSSGGAIYGNTEGADEDALPSPMSYYAVHKYVAERYLALSGVSYAIARLANAYGPGQRAGLEGGVVAVFAEALASGEPITIHGSGDQRRDFVHVDDIVEALAGDGRDVEGGHVERRDRPDDVHPGAAGGAGGDLRSGERRGLRAPAGRRRADVLPAHRPGRRGPGLGAEDRACRRASIAADRSRVKIAIVGTRGIPAAYGGFETLRVGALDAARRPRPRRHRLLPARPDRRVHPAPAGHPAPVPARYLPGKYPETVSHTALSILDSLVRGYDAMWVGNVGERRRSAGIPRLRGTRVVLNVDGIERQRQKWGLVGRPWYAVGERFALVYPNAIVSDAEVIRDYYREALRQATPTVITYGAPLLDREPAPDLARHGLDAGRRSPGRYLLYVSRLEPENQADLVIRAYREVPGDIAAADRGRRAVRRGVQGTPARARRRGSPGPPDRRDLRRRLPRPPARRDGLHPGDVGRRHAPGAHRGDGRRQPRARVRVAREPEVLDGTGLLFDDEASLRDALTRVVAAPDAAEFAELRAAARRRVEACYSWDAITDAYLALWRELGADRGIAPADDDDRRQAGPEREPGRSSPGPSPARKIGVTSDERDRPPVPPVHEPGHRQEQQQRVVVPQDRRQQLAHDHRREVRGHRRPAQRGDHEHDAAPAPSTRTG